MLLNTYLSIISILLVMEITECARILGVFPLPSISHQVVYRALTLELARRGHELVVLTPDPALPKDRPPDNVKEIDVHDFSYAMFRQGLQDTLNKNDGKPLTPYQTSAFMIDTIYPIFDKQLSSPEMKELMDNQTEKFDLVIVEFFRPTLLLTHRFKAPVILITSFGGMIEYFEVFGTPTNTILYPDVWRRKIINFNMWDKISELYLDLWMRYFTWKSETDDNRLIRKYLGEGAPSISELKKNIDLMLINVNPIWDGIRPLTPNVVYMGGIHLQTPKSLPSELKKFLDNSTQGVVYMSLGSNIRSAHLPDEKVQVFLRVFASLPFNVLWKWESDHLPGQPSNVRISKWLPQNDLLRHPNLKVFITQGGLQSTDEAISAQVPLIGIPFIGDQEMNVQKYIKHGIGVKLDITTLTEANLLEAILTVSKDKRYKVNIQCLSRLMADQLQPPLERAAWWVEHVLRHGGARHLRSPAADVSFIEYYLLDVISAILGLTVFILFFTMTLIRFLLCTFKTRVLLTKTKTS